MGLLPFVISQWVSAVHWAFVFAFGQVFFLWCLNFIAIELENPFGHDANDLNAHHMQLELNMHLQILLSPRTMRSPILLDSAADLTSAANYVNDKLVEDGATRCFRDCWMDFREDSDTEPIKVQSRSSFARPKSLIQRAQTELARATRIASPIGSHDGLPHPCVENSAVLLPAPVASPISNPNMDLKSDE